MRAPIFVWVCIHAGVLLGTDRATGRLLEGARARGEQMRQRATWEGRFTVLSATSAGVDVAIPTGDDEKKEDVRLLLIKQKEGDNNKWAAWGVQMFGETEPRYLGSDGAGAQVNDLNLDVNEIEGTATIAHSDELDALYRKLTSNAVLLGKVLRPTSTAESKDTVGVEVNWPVSIRGKIADLVARRRPVAETGASASAYPFLVDRVLASTGGELSFDQGMSVTVLHGLVSIEPAGTLIASLQSD